MTTSQISLDGDLESTTEGLIISTTNTNIFDSSIKSIAKYRGEEAEKWTKKAIENGAFKKIEKLIIDGAGSLVSSGINSLLGSFVGGFNKEQKTIQTVELRTNGTITLSGELKKLETGNIIPLTLSISPEDVGRLGVWSLSDYPFLELDPYAIHHKQFENDEFIQIYKTPGPHVYHCDKNKLNINPDLLSSIKNYKIEGKIYETDKVVLYDALGEGNKGVHSEYRLERGTNLYDNIYQPPFHLYTGVVLKDSEGNELQNLGDKSPYEIFLPITKKGELGAVPHTTFRSYYILVINMIINVNENNTVVSSHTFIPRFRWNYNSSGEWYYNVYPFTPIENF